MANKKNDSTLWAFLGAFLTIVGFLLVIILRKEDKYAMYYAKLGLILFVAAVVVSILGIIPFIGWIITLVGNIILLVLWIMSWVAALSGQKKQIPVISDLAKKF
jgi:uncharacterized membrane protein